MPTKGPDAAMTLDLLLIGLAITLEPIPLIAFVVVLASRNGVRKGAAFIAGWLLSLVVVVTATVLVTGNNPPKSNTAPTRAALAVKILIGVVLVAVAVRQWRRLGRPKPPKKVPKWQASVDSMSLWFAFGLAPLTQPWGLIAAGAATVVDAKLASWESALALVGFCVAATAVYLALEINAALRPAQSAAVLERLRSWMDTHTDQVIVVVSLVIGLWLIGDSLYLVLS